MHENFSSSEESESDSESDDDDAIAEADEHYFLSEDDEHSTVPASSGTSSDAHPAPALAAPAQEGDDGWARRREEAAQADAHAKHRRKAMLKRLTKARNRIRECMLRVREWQLVKVDGVWLVSRRREERIGTCLGICGRRNTLDAAFSLHRTVRHHQQCGKASP
jgi:hypothetical protein